jgi:nucleoside-diphosphate-sugar epimerase
MNALVTGGAGFIGSHVAEALLANGHATRVLDDLSSGYPENVPAGAEFVEGDVAEPEVVRKALAGIDIVFHFAAHRAVLRSVEHPLETDRANARGTLVVLDAARAAGVRRFVYASSSSVYGGAVQRPTPEIAPTVPRSPYAVTKLTGEHYCRVFTELYGLETVALRYFNVYGPRQRPDSAYAGVIPLFIRAISEGSPVTVHGDGLQSRDFTFIADVVSANLAAATAPSNSCSGNVYNIAAGGEHTLLDLVGLLESAIGHRADVVHTERRAGDVRHSRADISRSRRDLGFEPRVSFAEGLHDAVAWFQNRGAPGVR